MNQGRFHVIIAVLYGMKCDAELWQKGEQRKTIDVAKEMLLDREPKILLQKCLFLKSR